MKKFTFPLDRVLTWRRTQARLEEAKLGRLQAELHQIAARQTALELEHGEARANLAAVSSARGAELAALGHYRAAAARQSAGLEQARAEVDRLIAAQMQQAAARRREARLLEKLRDRRRAEWDAVFAREQQQQAEEAFLARWNATQ